MSTLKAFEYIETVLDESGFTQWEPVFDKENIGSTIIDRSYHVEFTGSTKESQGNKTLSMRHSFLISIFFVGYQKEKVVSRELLAECESVIQELCGYTKTLQNINAVEFSRLQLVPFDEVENDNILVGVIEVDVILDLCLID